MLSDHQPRSIAEWFQRTSEIYELQLELPNNMD